MTTWNRFPVRMLSSLTLYLYCKKHLIWYYSEWFLFVLLREIKKITWLRTSSANHWTLPSLGDGTKAASAVLCRALARFRVDVRDLILLLLWPDGCRWTSSVWFWSLSLLRVEQAGLLVRGRRSGGPIIISGCEAAGWLPLVLKHNVVAFKEKLVEHHL